MVPANIMLKSGIPRHEQISSWVRDQIERGVWIDNDQLPSESQLGRQFSVSRITIRRALQTLESEGLIYRKQGLGSYVSVNRTPPGLVRLTDFVEDLRSAGIHARSEILQFRPEVASPHIAEQLTLDAGTTTMRLDCLRFGDSQPIAFDTTWLPTFFAHLLDGKKLDRRSIYQILESDYNICISRGRYRIQSVNAPNDIAQHLDIPWGRALLLIERTSFTENEKPVYFQQRYYRSDRVAFDLELVRGSDSDAPASRGFPLQEFEPVFKAGTGK